MALAALHRDARGRLPGNRSYLKKGKTPRPEISSYKMQVKEAPLGKARAEPLCGCLVYARTARILLHVPLHGWADSASYPHLRGEVLVNTIG